MDKFRKLNLSEKILRVIEEEKFQEPSEIQEKAIPLVLQGIDVLGSSATGSGKTLVFGAGLIDKVSKGKGVQALILTPTRELAEQDSKSLKKFSKYYDISIREIYGGVSIEPQIRALEHTDVVVGTPGRILDHLERRTLDLRNVKFLVLDEADRMLEMGFIDDVVRIIEACPEERQTLLFSATIPPDIERIAKRYMKDAVHVAVESYVDPSKLEQVFYDAQHNIKFSLLVHLLKNEKKGLVMVFCNTRRNADILSRNLKRYGLHALAIHGGLAQNKRSNIMKMFHSQEVFILVCTDVAARGLDIKGVSHVYNYDIPKNSIDYIHRIGRTARAGKEGKAISIVSQRDYDNFRRVCEDSSLKITQESVPEIEELHIRFEDGRYGRGRSSGRDRRDFGRRDFRKDSRSPRSPRDRDMRGRHDGRDNRSRGFGRGFRRRY